MNTKPQPALPARSERGALLIVAMLISAVIAISIGSFLQLATQASQLSYRTLYAGSAMNASETGLEQAMWSVNKKRAGDASAWNGWSSASGGAVTRTFDLGTLSGGATVVAKVYVSNANLTGNPFVISRSIITPTRGPTVERWVKIELTKRSKFVNGLVAKNGISFSGNASIDSYDSSIGPYGGANVNDHTAIGSSSIEVSSLSIGNADVFGYVAIGTSDNSGLSVGPNGLVGPFGTSSGTITDGHVSNDFTADFTPESAPSATYTTIAAITDNQVLPRGGDTAADDGKYYYRTTKVDFNNKILSIAPDSEVVLVLTDSITSIDIGGGSGELAIASDSKLTVYAQGDVKIAGQGVANGTDADSNGTLSADEVGRPQNFLIYGTNTTGIRDYQIAGNGALSAVVYAPNADIKVNGNGDIMGAFIGNKVGFSGSNAAFHYDESLAELTDGSPFGIEDWREYVSYADRGSLGSIMNF